MTVGDQLVVSACLWGLREPPAEAARRLAGIGVDGVDVDPGFTGELSQLAGAVPVSVKCLAADHLMPPGGRLGDSKSEAGRIGVEHVRSGIREAAELGTEAVYVAPPPDNGASLRDFEESVVLLASEADSAGLRFCIEHVPSFKLSSAAATVEFATRTDHPNVYLLIDIGHCLIVGESPAEAIRAAGDRLGYVHVDDNDGKDDLHLALTDGLFDADDVCEILRALQESPYDGPVSVEVKNDLEDPLAAVEKTMDVLVSAQREL
ncbi:MAG: sugar phosphate isomerase/epimerase [Chloroflexi bacterium]|nr:sugar phosphate isomerase/epimerase [Chloroflexota bacterium]